MAGFSEHKEKFREKTAPQGTEMAQKFFVLRYIDLVLTKWSLRQKIFPGERGLKRVRQVLMR
ncbi:MAG TPA: hypothetical protein DCZ04_10065 [Syntrophorhabdus aromaticivorans]|nr:hypothetical protein [Syntrophorhabdus aromaticivorans]